MVREFKLTIADVVFSISTPPGVEIVEDEDLYAAFLGPPSDRSDVIQFPFRLSLDEPPDVRRFSPLFETGEAWRAFRDGDDTVLTLPSPTGFSGHFWVVRLVGGDSPHVLHCGPALIRSDDERTVVINPLRYPLDQLLMMNLMARHRCAIVHAAGLHRNGVGALFAGVSGAGKSTLTGLLSGVVDLRHLSDDRVVVRQGRDGVQIYGTPWPGEAGIAVNERADLGSVVLLRQADRHGLRPLEPRQALERLLPMVSILWYDAGLTTASLAWLDELLREVPAYELSFRRDEGVAETVGELFSCLPG